MKAIRLTATGGPEVLALVDLDAPAPGPGQIRVRQTAIGVNYIDTYHRSGLYPLKLPSGLGMEGAGEVDAVGEGVTRFAPGDRVAFASGPIGAYAEWHCVDASRAVRIPEGVEDRAAAAALLKGMTAEFLLLRCRPVAPGETVLIHAGAGGVGQILVQWAKALGAQVIATAGSAAKGDRVRDLGPTTSSSTANRTWRPRSAGSPRVQGFRSPTTPSGRRPSRAPWPACRGGASLSASETLQAHRRPWNPAA